MDAEFDPCQRFALLACAISGRPLEVAAGEPRMPAWTDGRTVFVDAAAAHVAQVQCVVVQACLLCAGSLESGVLQKLVRKPTVTRRYLSLEGHRALMALFDLLPTSVHPVIHPLIALRTDSPQRSLALALGSEEIADPPAVFGVIRPRMVGSAGRVEIERRGPNHDSPKQKPALLRELEDDIGEGPVVDILSSPVGGGGPIGRLLKRLLGEARSSGTGAPGADAPTRFARSSTRASSMSSPTTSRMTEHDDGPLGTIRRFVYPEWDVHRRRYRRQWCTVVEIEPDDEVPARDSPRDTRSLRRAGPARDRARTPPSPTARRRSRS